MRSSNWSNPSRPNRRKNSDRRKKMRTGASLSLFLCAWVFRMLAQTSPPPIQASAQPSVQSDAAVKEVKIAEDYYLGRGVPKDYEKAVLHYRLAADQGSADGQAGLAYMYLYGLGVAQDDAQAAKWYKLAAQNGSAVGQAYLGDLYRLGRGVERDAHVSAEWFRRAADHGLAGAQHQLAWFYLEGEGVTKNESEAAKWFQLAADQGFGPAQKDLGILYSQGRGVPKDSAKAAALFRVAAEGGLAEAQVLLADAYFGGKGVPQDDNQAASWARRASDQNDPLGKFVLACLYTLGRGVKQDFSEAFKLSETASKESSSPAEFLLAMLYENGAGVQRDDGKAIGWARKSAEAGFPLGQQLLAQFLVDGRGEPANLVEAAKWYQKAAENGLPQSQSVLGTLYLDGKGVPRDDKEAAKWFQLAADQGFAEGQNRLGLAYLRGQGLTKDDNQAFAYFRKASEQSYVFAHFNLAGMYLNGQGTTRDEAKALELYAKAADAGFGPAEEAVARLYTEGRGTEKNLITAAEYYKRAAEKGSLFAQREIATMYRKGAGVAQDYVQAAKWYLRAAEQGDTDAQTMLGYSYLEGQGVERNSQTALDWFRKSANAGAVESQYILGLLYQNGRGGEPNMVEARTWFERAASQGYAKARERLQELIASTQSTPPVQQHVTRFPDQSLPNSSLTDRSSAFEARCEEYNSQERQRAEHQAEIAQLDTELRNLQFRQYQATQNYQYAQQLAMDQSQRARTAKGLAAGLAAAASIAATAGALKLGSQVQALNRQISQLQYRRNAMAITGSPIKYFAPPEGCAPSVVATALPAPTSVIAEPSSLSRQGIGSGTSGLLGGLQKALGSGLSGGNVVGGLTDTVKQQGMAMLQDEIVRRVGEFAGLGMPLRLDQKTAFPEARAPQNFRPRRITVHSMDLHRPLPPGDYSMTVWAYCTQWSIHAPGAGLGYKLARGQGKQAMALSALLSRGTLEHISHDQLIATDWRIQSGTPLSQMPSSDQAMIHHLIPEYERGLHGDVLEKIYETYNKFRVVPNVPTLDSLLARNEAGRVVLNILHARQILADQTISAERLPDHLFEPQGDGLPRVLPATNPPQPSPWAEIYPGVVARLTVQAGTFGDNLFEFRVTSPARHSKQLRAAPVARAAANSFLPQNGATDLEDGETGPWPADLFGLVLPGEGADTTQSSGNRAAAHSDAQGLLIGYSMGKGAQALTLVPAVESGSGSPSDCLSVKASLEELRPSDCLSVKASLE